MWMNKSKKSLIDLFWYIRFEILWNINKDEKEKKSERNWRGLTLVVVSPIQNFKILYFSYLLWSVISTIESIFIHTHIYIYIYIFEKWYIEFKNNSIINLFHVFFFIKKN